MRADELHLAAMAERDEWGSDDTRRTYPKSSAVHLALATLLDTLAYRAEEIYETTHEFELRERMARRNVAGFTEALIVARAILDGAS